METVTSTSTRADAPAAPRPLATCTVGVVMGGRSPEREVSLQSGARVLAALSVHPAGELPGPERAIGIEVQPDGTWRAEGRALPPVEALAALADVDVFFLALHGGEGEGGTVQGFLASAGRPFTGSGVLASAVVLDKVFARELVAARGVRVAPAAVLAPAHSGKAGRAELRRRLRRWQVPGWVVKPRFGGSSIGVRITRTEAELAPALDEAAATGEEILVEALVEGVEVTGGVVPDEDGSPRSLPAIEIQPHDGHFFDYEEKYSETGAREICPPVSVPGSVARRTCSLSLLVHRYLRCEGFSRSDFIVPEGEEEPVFLEANTLPGLTARSLVPLAAAEAGIDYRALCLRILAEGLRLGPRTLP